MAEGTNASDLRRLLEEEATNLEARRNKIMKNFSESIEALRTLAKQAEMLSPAFVDAFVKSMLGTIAEGDRVNEFTEDDDGTDDTDRAAAANHARDPELEGTVFMRMVQFFKKRGNKPASNLEVREAVGASRGTVAMVLYNTHADYFEKIQVQGKKKTHWRLNAFGMLTSHQ